MIGSIKKVFQGFLGKVSNRRNIYRGQDSLFFKSGLLSSSSDSAPKIEICRFLFYFSWLLENLVPLTDEIIEPVYVLADYLGIDALVNDLTSILLERINSGYEMSEQVQEILDIKLLEAVNIIRNNNFIQNLPIWVQPIFNHYETRRFPTEQNVLIRIHPFRSEELPTTRSLFQGYSRKCQISTQPTVISFDQAISQIQSGRQVIRYNHPNGQHYYLTCLDPDYPFIRTTESGLCCGFINRNLETNGLDIVPLNNENLSNTLQGKIAYNTDSGFYALMNPGYVGDYIYVNNYVPIPQINAIVV